MKVAKVELGAKELELLRAGKPIIIRLPDAQVEITVSESAQFWEKLDDVLRGFRKAQGRATART